MPVPITPARLRQLIIPAIILTIPAYFISGLLFLILCLVVWVPLFIMMGMLLEGRAALILFFAITLLLLAFGQGTRGRG